MSDGEIHADSSREGKLVTLSQVVAYNLKYFRRAAGLTQEEMGERLGNWSAASVSAAERSWDGKRIRKFDADEIVAIADVVGVPVVALLLPPPESAGRADYTFVAGPVQMTADDLVQQVITDYQGETPAMAAFMDRLMKIGGSRFMGAVRSEAERILVQARDQAQQLIGESGNAAREIERVAQERQHAMRPLVQQVEELQRRIDDLRAFEQEYHTRLIRYLETQLRDLKASLSGDDGFPALGEWPDPTLPAPRGEDGKP